MVEHTIIPVSVIRHAVLEVLTSD